MARRYCPVCNAITVKHCPSSPTCAWWRCQGAACHARIDYDHMRGFQLLPGDVVRPFSLLKGGEVNPDA